MSKHTPGPWKARASHACDDFGIIAPDTNAEGGWVCIAECFSDIRRANEQALPEAAANARRIVQCVNAHDDLLQAARAVAFSNGFDAALPEKLEALRAAIAKAKATGEQA